MKQMAILLAVLLLAVPALALRASIANYDPLPAKAGEYVNVFVSIENPNDAPSKPVTLELNPRDGLSLAEGEDANRNLGVLFQLRSTVAKYRLRVSPDAVDGDNRIDVFVHEQGYLAQRFELFVNVENTFPQIELGQVVSTPRELLPDSDDVRLDVTLINSGDDAALNVRARLELPAELEFSDAFANQVYLGAIGENDSIPAVFLVDVPEETRGGRYPAFLIVDYTRRNDPENRVQSARLPFDVVVKPAPRFGIKNVRTTPASLTQGDRGVLMTVELENTGGADAENVRAKIFPKSEHPFEFDTTFGFVSPKLEPGQSGEVTFEFRVKDDAPLQTYQMEVEVKSFVDEQVRLETEVVPVKVENMRANEPPPFLWIGGVIAVLLAIAIAYWRRKAKAREKQNELAGKNKKSENGK